MLTAKLLALPETNATVATYEGGNPDGQPLFFLHGNSLAADTFGRQWWDPALQRFRLVAMDLPGHGQSSALLGKYSVPAMRGVVRATMQALGVEQALAVGHSYGGNLLLELLPDLPGLRGLLTVGAPPVGTPADMQAAFRLSETGMLFYEAVLSAAQTEALARYCLRPASPVDEVALLAANIARTDGRARPDLLASIGAGDLSDEVAHVRQTAVPLAFVVGEFEEAIHFAYFDGLAASSRWGKALHVVPGSGHSPMLENPAAFNQFLLEFAVATGRP